MAGLYIILFRVGEPVPLGAPVQAAAEVVVAEAEVAAG